MKTTSRLWIGLAALAVLAVLSPIGLILPEYLKADSAWGEWSAERMRALVGYIPSGLQKISSIWNAPMAGYVFKGWEEKPLPHLSVAYIVSAFIGMGFTILAVFAIGRLLARRDR